LRLHIPVQIKRKRESEEEGGLKPLVQTPSVFFTGLLFCFHPGLIEADILYDGIAF
jgi:hypothetical protein